MTSPRKSRFARSYERSYERDTQRLLLAAVVATQAVQQALDEAPASHHPVDALGARPARPTPHVDGTCRSCRLESLRAAHRDSRATLLDRLAGWMERRRYAR